MNGARAHQYKNPTPKSSRAMPATTPVSKPSQPTSMPPPEIPRTPTAPPAVRGSPLVRETTARRAPRKLGAPPTAQKTLETTEKGALTAPPAVRESPLMRETAAKKVPRTRGFPPTTQETLETTGKRAPTAPPTVQESPLVRETAAKKVPSTLGAPQAASETPETAGKEAAINPPASQEPPPSQEATTKNAAAIARENSLRASLLRKKRGNTLWTLSLALLKAQSARPQGNATELVPPDFPIKHDYGVGILAGGTGFGEPENRQDQENWNFLRKCTTGTHSQEACLYTWILLLACVPELYSATAKAARIRRKKFPPRGPIAGKRLELMRNEAREYVKRYHVVEPFFRWFKTVGAVVKDISAVIMSDVAMRLAGEVDLEDASYPGGKNSAEKDLVGIAAEHVEFAERLWELIETV